MSLDWMRRAACAVHDPETWFPLEAQGRKPRDRDRVDNGAEAKAICATCPVRAECLDYGTREKESGIWGGVMLDRGKPRRGHASCGTESGARAHWKAGEPICHDCRDARNEARRRRRAERKAAA